MAFLLETSILEDSWDLVRLEAAPLFFFVPPSFLPGLYFSLTVSLSMQLTFLLPLPLLLTILFFSV